MAWEAIGSDGALATLLEQLAAAFDCTSAALVYKDRLTPAADITVAHGPFADAAVQRRYALEFAALDPAPAALGRLAIGDVGDTDALFPLAERDLFRPFLDGFYHPLGLAGALGAPLSKGERIGMVAVHRDSGRRPFDAADAARLRRLVPHLVRMIELRQVFFALDARAARLKDALEPLVSAVMIVDARGALLEANGSARALVARGDGLSVTRAGLVTASGAKAVSAFHAALKVTAPDESLVRVPRAAGNGAYVVRVRRRREPPGWVIMVSDPDGRDGSAPQVLAAALGLSAGAAELLAALFAGETLNQFCNRREMSRNTAKYHLRAAFAATGTRRQASLLRYVTKVLCDLSL